MSFIRIRTINGRRYRYEEERWREAGKVRSRSRCLGAVDDADGDRKIKQRRGGLFALLSAQRLSPEDRAWAAVAGEAERVEQYQREQFGETAQERAERERQEHLDKLHAAYGLRLGPSNPVPVEPRSAPANAEAKESPAEAGLTGEPSDKSE